MKSPTVVDRRARRQAPAPAEPVAPGAPPESESAGPELERFGFLLMPEFSMLSFASMLEPLRIANRINGKQLYQWELLSPDDGTVQASNGIPFAPTRRRDLCEELQTVVVVAGLRPLHHSSPALQAWLRALARRGVRLGGTSAGPLVLARARLLEGHRCTIHWENLDGFREQYPGIQATSELFECDRERFTCSGGTAGLDLMLHLIGLRHGPALARAVAEQCIHPRIRPAHDAQRMVLPQRLRLDHPRLLQAVALMDNHLEDPLPSATLAGMVGLSPRQFERQFRERLGATPARYYKRMRLERARALLEHTAMPLLQVAVACGFASATHFSASYRQQFGDSPATMRARLRAG